MLYSGFPLYLFSLYLFLCLFSAPFVFSFPSCSCRVYFSLCFPLVSLPRGVESLVSGFLSVSVSPSLPMFYVYHHFLFSVFLSYHVHFMFYFGISYVLCVSFYFFHIILFTCALSIWWSLHRACGHWFCHAPTFCSCASYHSFLPVKLTTGLTCWNVLHSFLHTHKE